jgi:hypothetical protein
MKIRMKIAPLLALGSIAFGISAYGITIGGINFQDNAFADILISSSGSFTTVGGTLAQVLTDKDPGTFAFSRDPGSYVELGFTDNNLVNGPGEDLALFELGVVDTFQVSLTIGGTTRNYGSSFTGETAGGFPLNLAKVDLSDFGVADGASLNGVVIGLSFLSTGGTTVPSLSLVGAINSSDIVHGVPDGGSTAGLLALAAGALGMTRFGRKA